VLAGDFLGPLGARKTDDFHGEAAPNEVHVRLEFERSPEDAATLADVRQPRLSGRTRKPSATTSLSRPQA
jgi:hypothetical protein